MPLCVTCVCLSLWWSLDVSGPAILKQTNEEGGLKFLLLTFRAHGRNSSLIEVKGDRRESRGQAKMLDCGSEIWMQ